MNWIYLNDSILDNDIGMALREVSVRPSIVPINYPNYSGARIDSINHNCTIRLYNAGSEEPAETYSFDTPTGETVRHRLLSYETIGVDNNEQIAGVTFYDSVPIYGSYKIKGDMYIDDWCPCDSFIPFEAYLEAGSERTHIYGIDGIPQGNTFDGEVFLTNTNLYYYVVDGRVVNSYLIRSGDVVTGYENAIITFEDVQYVPSFFADFINKYFDRVYKDNDSVDIIFYNNSAEPNRVDKTDYLTSTTPIRGTFRESVSITAPTIILNFNGIFNYNYMYIPILHRYYFITDVVSLNKNLWMISCSEDVLMSYKNALFRCKAFVTRNEFENDALITDTKRIIRNGYDIEKRLINVGLFDATPTPDSFNYIISGIAVRVAVSNSTNKEG